MLGSSCVLLKRLPTGTIEMDQQLDARWRAKQSPFDGDIIYLDDYIPIAPLRTALVLLVAILQQNYQTAKLYTLRDWHEHDGYIWSRQSTNWQSVEQLVASDQALYDGRAGDTFVRLAYYPSDSSFLLRIYVMDENEEPEYPGRWGNFDLSATHGLLTTISTQLPDFVQRLLRRERSGTYFDQSYAG
jgi:hypothetical protein